MNARSPAMIDYLLLGVLSLIFGSSFIFTNIAVQSLGPLTVVTGRLLIATMVLFPLMHVSGQALPGVGRIWIFITAAALFGNAIPFTLISWGQVKVDAGLTAIFMAVMPLITVLLAHVVTADEKMNRYTLIGVVCGLLGVVVLMGWDQLAVLGDSMVRQYAIVIAAFCYAVNAILTKRLTGIPRLSMISALMLVATVSLLPFTLWLEQPWQAMPSVSAGASVVALALGSTALATLIILTIIDRQGASFMSQINFLVPLAGVALARIFLHETLPTTAWIALGIIMLGIGLSRLGSRARR